MHINMIYLMAIEILAIIRTNIDGYLIFNGH